MFVWVIVAAIVGARAMHVLSNLSDYTAHPAQVFAIWQGGLSSFGGLILAVPVAIVSQRRRCPELPTLRFADLMAPVLMACWAMGRLLGPQLMVNGGGHPTQQWFGMYYAGAHPDQKVLPVPIFQAMEDFTIFCILLLVERWLRSRTPSVASDGSPLPAPSPPCPPPVSCSGSGWCCGASSAISTSTCGWARTGTSDRCWSRSPASRSRSPASSCSPRGSARTGVGATPAPTRCHRPGDGDGVEHGTSDVPTSGDEVDQAAAAVRGSADGD